MTARGILVTGFEPFGSIELNSSWEVASQMPSEINGVRIFVEQLPVVFFKSLDKIHTILEENECITDVLLLGEFGGIPSLKVETIGVQSDDSDASENEGLVRRDSETVKNAPDGRTAKVLVKQVDHLLKRQCGSPANISWVASQFLCNHPFSGPLHKIEMSGKSFRVGFVHLPFAFRQGARSSQPGLPANEMAEQVKHIIKNLISS